MSIVLLLSSFMNEPTFLRWILKKRGIEFLNGRPYIYLRTNYGLRFYKWIDTGTEWSPDITPFQRHDI